MSHSIHALLPCQPVIGICRVFTWSTVICRRVMTERWFAFFTRWRISIHMSDTMYWMSRVPREQLSILSTRDNEENPWPIRANRGRGEGYHCGGGLTRRHTLQRVFDEPFQWCRERLYQYGTPGAASSAGRWCSKQKAAGTSAIKRSDRKAHLAQEMSQKSHALRRSNWKTEEALRNAGARTCRRDYRSVYFDKRRSHSFHIWRGKKSGMPKNDVTGKFLCLQRAQPWFHDSTRENPGWTLSKGLGTSVLSGKGVYRIRSLFIVVWFLRDIVYFINKKKTSSYDTIILHTGCKLCSLFFHFERHSSVVP